MNIIGIFLWILSTIGIGAFVITKPVETIGVVAFFAALYWAAAKLIK